MQMSDRNDTCELGRRFRTITCVDNGGEEVNEMLCSQSQEGNLFSVLFLSVLYDLSATGRENILNFDCELWM